MERAEGGQQVRNVPVIHQPINHDDADNDDDADDDTDLLPDGARMRLSLRMLIVGISLVICGLLIVGLRAIVSTEPLSSAIGYLVAGTTFSAAGLFFIGCAILRCALVESADAKIAEKRTFIEQKPTVSTISWSQSKGAECQTSSNMSQSRDSRKEVSNRRRRGRWWISWLRSLGLDEETSI